MTGILFRAVSEGRPRQVRLLLDSGIDIEKVDECGQTPLISTIFIDHARNRYKILKILLKRGAIVSKKDIVGRNALSWACLYGYDKEVELLLQHSDLDLDLNQGDINGQTALYHAATSGNAATVKLMVDALLKHGLSVDMANLHGISPLMQALKLGYNICASILINQGKATAGMNMVTQEDFTNAEKWATKTRKTEQQITERKFQFPPIIPQAVAQKIKYRENLAGKCHIYLPLDSDDDEDSTYSSEVSYYTDESFGSFTLPDHDFSPPTKNQIAWSVHFPQSISSSTEANATSSDEEDKDMAPYSPPPKKIFNSMKDLPKLYEILQEQNTYAYRPPAKAAPKMEPILEIEQEPLDQEFFKERSNYTMLRKMVVKKQARKNMRLAELSLPVAPTKFPPPPFEVTSSSDTENEGIKMKLPRIGNGRKKAFLVEDQKF